MLATTLDRRKQKKHQWSNHVWKRISTGFKLFKWFSGSTGLIGSTSGFLEGLLDAVADLRRHWLKSCYWSDCLWWWIIINLQRKNTLRSTHDWYCHNNCSINWWICENGGYNFTSKFITFAINWSVQREGMWKMWL